ncbi:hypothetical protein EYW49_15320 [Siculibacillus lacustris]|uniref:Uncharacterized protein n=1 Tax=Siculibacillus lacustris TaxID=1549641 RepID=A0A4Q9VKM3_9HYPH|nr:hypothetical protein [Siculibacillus lacustris]TBW35980.1 hypothetical protein EYW49_15320 [Siculibacillus lacustris]
MTTVSDARGIDLGPIKIGLALVLITLALNIGLGAMFGLNEDLFQDYIKAGIAAHPTLFPDAAKEAGYMWRWIQRAHFHAGGIGAFSLGLVILTALTDLSVLRKRITAGLIGLSGFYPVAWFLMFYYAPLVGRTAAHHLFVVELCTDIGVGGLCLGLLSLVAGIFLPKRA